MWRGLARGIGEGAGLGGVPDGHPLKGPGEGAGGAHGVCGEDAVPKGLPCGVDINSFPAVTRIGRLVSNSMGELRRARRRKTMTWKAEFQNDFECYSRVQSRSCFACRHINYNCKAVE